MAIVLGCVLWIVGVMFYQNPIEKLDNKDKSFTLIKNDTVNESSIPVLKYKVMRNADKRIVIEGTVTMGKVEWTADYELTESKSTGTAASLNLSSRKIDLRPFLVKN
jgi:hypothetical protein